jgi:hypothetical protein
VHPSDIGETALEFLARFRTTPRGIGSKVEVALSHGIAVRIRATFIMLAL